ncbi:MAG: HTTM domain-containing protein [Planctomycetota bacterium]|nr:HTTM domain-containing protein [Planctomycetota bacterium]
MQLLPAWTAPNQRASAVPLAGFRILFGLCLIFDITALIEYAPMWFDKVPFVDPAVGWRAPALWLWLLAAIGLTVGAFTRVCAILNYVGCVAFMSFQAMPASYEYHLDNLYLVTSCVLPFLPLGHVWSVDAWRRPPATQTIGPGAEIFFALIVSSIYLDSALWKLSSSMWMNGLGYWTVAVRPWDRMPSFGWTLDNEWIARGSGYIVLVFELLFVFLVWFRKLRLPLILIGMVLHIGIGTFLPIPLFGLIMSSFLVALVALPLPRGAAEVEAGPARWHPGVKAYYATWAVFFSLGAIDPVLAIREHGIGGSTTEHHRFWFAKREDLFAKRFAAGMWWSYRVFGWRSHPIFIDNQFSLYTTQTRLRFHEGDPDLEVEGEGDTFYPPHRNRRFLALYYRTLWPSDPRDKVERRLTRFLDYHVGREHLDLERGFVTIEQRPLVTPVDRWNEGQLTRNSETPWRRVGTVRGTPGELEFTWADPCWPVRVTAVGQ